MIAYTARDVSNTIETKEFDSCFFKYLVIHDLIEYLAYFTCKIIYLIL